MYSIIFFVFSSFRIDDNKKGDTSVQRRKKQVASRINDTLGILHGFISTAL